MELKIKLKNNVKEKFELYDENTVLIKSLKDLVEVQRFENSKLQAKFSTMPDILDTYEKKFKKISEIHVDL